MRWGRPYGLRNNTRRMSAKRFSADMRPLYTRAQQGCARQPLVLRSYMPENGVIFSDGLEQDYLQFNAGAVATIGVAARKVKSSQAWGPYTIRLRKRGQGGNLSKPAPWPPAGCQTPSQIALFPPARCRFRVKPTDYLM